MEPRPRSTACHRWMVPLIVGLLVIAAGRAKEPPALGGRRAPNEIEAELRAPRIEGRFRVREEFFLEIAHARAVERLERRASCRALFDDLTVDGLQALGRCRYRPVRTVEERKRCTRGVLAYTVVGGDRILLCRAFHALHEGGKAVVLLHEALHAAGMGEAPDDPGGRTPEEINELVERACGLSL